MESHRIRVGVLSYLNSQPFVHGLRRGGLERHCRVTLDTPARLAAQLRDGRLDVALVPVAALPHLARPRLLTEYCIGANGAVDTVLLVSDVPLSAVTRVYLDPQSQTSVALARLLARHRWKIAPAWVPARPGYERAIGGTAAGVVIGDRAFAIRRRFRFVYDLAQEWTSLTGLPFVFACWAATRPLPAGFAAALNRALRGGVAARAALVPELQARYPEADVGDYLMHKIDFRFDGRKRAALTVFLDGVAALGRSPPPVTGSARTAA